MDAPTPLDLRKGARLRTLRPLECAVSIHWAAPYTTGHEGLVPAGEVLEVNHDFPEESGLVSLAPEGYVALEPWLAGEASSQASRYQGYSLMAKRVAVEAACRPARPDDPAPHAGYDAPERFRSEGGIVVTDIGVISPGRRFFHEGIADVSVELRRGNRKVAGYLLLFGILFAAALVGFAMIAAALVLYLHKRHEVVIRYAGEPVPLEKFADRADAQALADAITARRRA